MNKSQESKNKYLREKVDEIKIRVPKGDKEKYKELARNNNISLNGLVSSTLKYLISNKNSLKFLLAFNNLNSNNRGIILNKINEILSEKEVN